MLSKICNFISKYMAVIVIVVAAMALLLPVSFNWISTAWITPFLGLVMFGMGLTLDPHDFKVVFTRPKDIIIGSLSQFIIMPLAAFLPAFSSVMIALIVGIIVSANAPKLLTGGLLIVLVVMLHNICGLSLGYLVGRLLRLPHHKCSAISIEVGMQNSGLASSLATVHFAMYPMATVPGAIFSVWHNVSGAVVAKIYARKQEKLEETKQ